MIVRRTQPLQSTTKSKSEIKLVRIVDLDMRALYLQRTALSGF